MKRFRFYLAFWAGVALFVFGVVGYLFAIYIGHNNPSPLIPFVMRLPFGFALVVGITLMLPALGKHPSWPFASAIVEFFGEKRLKNEDGES